MLVSKPVPDRRHSFIQRAHYQPPWANTSIIGIAGSSGSGKTSLAIALIERLNLPWVVIMSMDSFYKPLSPAQRAMAFRNEYDFDSPNAIDFDLLVEKLRILKSGKRAEIPVYSFEKHNREKETTSIYSPHVIVLEGIFALHDPRVLEILDLKVFADAEPDLCLSRRLLRDVKERGRDIQGCIKQWFSFVKPNYLKYVEPQRNISDIIVPRGIENSVAISMMTDSILKTLAIKSAAHTTHLNDLTPISPLPLPSTVYILPETPQMKAMHTSLQLPKLATEDFIFTMDRMGTFLIEYAVGLAPYRPGKVVMTPQGTKYVGRHLPDIDAIAATILLRGGSVLETALHRVLPAAPTARLLIQTNYRTGEPELHYMSAFPASLSSKTMPLPASPVVSPKSPSLENTSSSPLYSLPNGHLPTNYAKFADLTPSQTLPSPSLPPTSLETINTNPSPPPSHSSSNSTIQKPKQSDLCLLLDSQMSSGGAALMAVRVLVDHGVPEHKIVVVAYLAGAAGLGRLCAVYPEVKVVVGRIVSDGEERWVERRYLGC